ncbi:MAG TPA: hypothetical protein DCW29_06350 [Janthinobacterium sp.]|nr:hypothetical protein [Janthinobacterium sp.]
MVELIERCLGEQARKYVLNKKTGGESSKKGNRYEDYFLVYKAAEIAVEYLQKGGKWPSLHGQVLGFVDDVVVKAVDKTEYFQLKNSPSISWTKGDHPLETDFRYQFVIASYLNEPAPTTDLVVSDETLRAKLEESIPELIKAHTSARYFPYGEGHLNRVVLESKHLQELLSFLSKSVNPTLDELEGVFGVLLIASCLHPDGEAVDTMLRSANKRVPNLLRSLNVADLKQLIRADFTNTIAAIPGLTYAFDKGFFSWNAFGTSGIFPFDCSDAQFAQFQEIVVLKHPITFDDFEGLLP